MAIPKLDDLRALADGLIEDGEARNLLYDELEELYDQANADEDGIEPDDEEGSVESVTMPYSTNSVNLVQDLATEISFTIEVPAGDETKPAQERADTDERWFRALFDATQARENRNLIGEMSWFGAMRARVVTRVLLNEAAISKTEDGYALAGLPVLIQHRDPKPVYFERGPLGPKTVVEAWRRRCSTIRNMHPNALKDRDKYPDDGFVDWIELWTDKYRVYWADDEVVRVGGKQVVPHGYGVLPYSICDARVTPRVDEEKAVQPLLRAAMPLASNVDTWFSILATAGRSAVTNTYNVYSDRYASAGGPDLDTRDGAVNYFYDKERVEPLQRANLPADFFQLGSLFLQAFQQSTFPFAMYGEMDVAAAGYAINLMSSAGRRPMVPVWRAIEGALAGAFRVAALICRNLIADLVGKAEIPLVYVASAVSPELKNRAVRRKVTLDTGSVGDDYIVSVTLGDPLPQDEATKLRMALEAAGGENPLLSHETSLTKYKVVPDAVAEADRIEVEKLYRQLAPVMAIRWAIEKGVLPQDLVIPDGWTLTPDGRLLPKSFVEPPPGAEVAPAVDPRQGATGLVEDPSMMQVLAGQTPPPSLTEAAGAPPPAPGGSPYG